MIFVLTATGLDEAVTTGSDLATQPGIDTSELSRQKATLQITSNRISYRHVDTHEQAHLGSNSTLSKSKKAPSAMDASRSQTLAIGTVTSASKEPGAIALLVSTRDNTAHTRCSQYHIPVQSTRTMSSRRTRSSTYRICRRRAMSRCQSVKTATFATIQLHQPTRDSTAIHAMKETTMFVTNATTALSPLGRSHKPTVQTAGEDA